MIVVTIKKILVLLKFKYIATWSLIKRVYKVIKVLCIVKEDGEVCFS